MFYHILTKAHNFLIFSSSAFRIQVERYVNIHKNAFFFVVNVFHRETKLTVSYQTDCVAPHTNPPLSCALVSPS